jgi:Na+-transporting NADH:ubiquinone oxidoreductase subunit NqrB
MIPERLCATVMVLKKEVSMKQIRILVIGVMLTSMLFMSLSTPRALGSANPAV